MRNPFSLKKEVDKKVSLPKYSIGDTVYYIDHAKIKSGVITAVALIVRADGAGYRYSTSENVSSISLWVVLKEEDLFSTKEALIASL